MRNLNFLNSNNSNHKSLRVRTNMGDTFLSVNLDQTYESLDILSLKIYQKDVYRLFDADYSVIVGRVTGQDVGIPNARISVFIETDEDTIIGPTNIDDIKKIEAAAIYPYKTVFDKDGNGKIYNLLPKYSRNRGFNGYPANENGIGATPKTPVGTLPEKEEILSNETLAYVYEKYYKFSTFTNESGDYILVVPSNRTYTVNMSCDITDIGKFSTTAALLKAEGGLPDFYFMDDNGVPSINPEIPLERLPNIDIQNQTIYTKPLWSQNPDNNNVGINRLDFKLQKKIQPFTTVIGNFFTQAKNRWWTRPTLSNTNEGQTRNGGDDIKINTHAKGSLSIRIFTLKNTVLESHASAGSYGPYDVNQDIELLQQSKYQFFQNNGNALITITCNRNKVVTNEFGEIVSVADDNETGAFTSFRGYFFVNNNEPIDNPPGGEQANKIVLRIPHLRYYGAYDVSNSYKHLIFSHYKFDYGEIYSWAQKNTVKAVTRPPEDEYDGEQTNILYFGENGFGNISRSSYLNKYPNANYSNSYGQGQSYLNFYNHLKEGTSADASTGNGNNNARLIFAIKNQWMNFSIYFINFEYRQDASLIYPIRVDSDIVPETDADVNFLDHNTMPLGGGQYDSRFLANGVTINTTFFKVDKEDLFKFADYRINNVTQLGFRIPKSQLKGSYPRYNNSNYGLSGTQTPSWLNQDNGDDVSERYFLIGQMNNNCIQYLFSYL